MSRVLGGTKKSAPLRTADRQPGEARAYSLGLAMRAAAARCETPRQVGMASTVPARDEARRVRERIENWRRK